MSYDSEQTAITEFRLQITSMLFLSSAISSTSLMEEVFTSVDRISRLQNRLILSSGIRASFKPENLSTMDTQETVLVSKVPMLKPNEFDMWKIRIRQYMLLTDYGMWEVVENGPGVDEAAAEGGARPPPRSDADRKRKAN
ncbi:hypothetical protein OSB04_025528 [Centaurea solstitialis]|uniref:Uncharacterized protein n=1 Tax=Centaurea solstitialis TaxID=347529 RepID=A0AA38T1M7_9ASTR|nr:hypothetical protein OSB04_025528 [Centaurea solstitialis]